MPTALEAKLADALLEARNWGLSIGSIDQVNDYNEVVAKVDEALEDASKVINPKATAPMGVLFLGSDVMIVDQLNRDGGETRCVIACNKKAEDALYGFAVKYLETGREIGYIRSAFGLTFYASDDVTKKDLMARVDAKKLRKNYGFV